MRKFSLSSLKKLLKIIVVTTFLFTFALISSSATNHTLHNNKLIDTNNEKTIKQMKVNQLEDNPFEIDTNNSVEYNTLRERLKMLEPEKAENIDDPPFYNEPLPSKVIPISEVINKGKEITIEFIYNDPDWKRQAYKSYWHSTVAGGRWSYVPTRIHFAMHRLFAIPPTGSSKFSYINSLGIAEQVEKFDYSGFSIYKDIETIIMQSDVKKIYTYGNQIVLLSLPMRTGLQVVSIPIDKIEPFNPNENILIQLSTFDAGEIDFTTATLIKVR